MIKFNFNDLIKFFQSNNGQKVLAFLAGKNNKEIGQWLINAGKAIQGGKTVAAKYLGAAGGKLVLLALATKIASNQVGRAVSNIEDIWAKSEDTELRKAWKTALELWPPTMMIKDLRAFSNFVDKQINNPDWIMKDGVTINEVRKIIDQKKDGTISESDYIQWMDEHSTGGKRKPISDAKTQQSSSTNGGSRNVKPNVDGSQSGTDDSHPMAQLGYNVNEYQNQAKANKMTPAPTNPTAYNEWRKRVETNMSVNENRAKKAISSKTNSPAWYWKGYANKLLASTLTWSAVKNYNASYPFVAAACPRVSLAIPTEPGATANKSKIHHEVSANIEVLWQALRGKNTGAYAYSEAELYWYVVALASLIAQIRYVHKFLAVLNTKPYDTFDVPKAMYRGMLKGNSNSATFYKNTINNYANIVAAINDVAKDLNDLAFLDCSLLSRWNYIADKALADYNGPKAVLGVYALEYVPKINSSGNLTYSLFLPTISSSSSVMTLVDDIRSQLDYFKSVTSGTPATGVAAKISGDMIKLLGAKNKTFLNAPLITGKEAITYQYDPEAFDQLRNARMFNALESTFPAYAGTEFNQPTIGVKLASGTATSINLGDYTTGDRIITTDRNKEFVAAENIQMVQFQCNLTQGSISSGQVTLYMTEHGTTVLNSIDLVYYTTGNAFTDYLVVALDCDNATGINYGSTTCNLFEQRRMPLMLQVDFMPRIQIVRASTDTIVPNSVWGDVDNYAFMNDKQYSDLNSIAAYSQFFFFKPEDVNIKGIVEQ